MGVRYGKRLSFETGTKCARKTNFKNIGNMYTVPIWSLSSVTNPVFNPSL